MPETQATETVAISPRTEPTRRDRNQESRTIEVRWNIGEPNADGGQRQALLKVYYTKGYGYVANATTVITTKTEHGESTEFTLSVLNWDNVYRQSTKGRYAQKDLTAAYELALELLCARFDDAHQLIVRHFDPTAPIPRD